MLHGVLAAFIDIPGSDRHGNPFDLLLRFFDIQADAVLDFMRRLFRFLQAGEFIFIVGIYFVKYQIDRNPIGFCRCEKTVNKDC